MLARQISAVVIFVNFRRTSVYRYPCQCEDGFDALKFIDGENFEGFPANVDLKRCFIVGDSSGGNIAHHVTIKAGKYEFRELKIIGVIAIQPFFGGEERTESEIEFAGAPMMSIEHTDWFWKAFLPEGSDRDHPVANIFSPKSEDISAVRFPAALVFIGGFDPLKDWQKRYYEGLKKSGKEAYLKEYPNAIHSFYAFPEFPEWPLFIKELIDFIQTQSSRAQT